MIATILEIIKDGIFTGMGITALWVALIYRPKTRKPSKLDQLRDCVKEIDNRNNGKFLEIANYRAKISYGKETE